MTHPSLSIDIVLSHLSLYNLWIYPTIRLYLSLCLCVCGWYLGELVLGGVDQVLVQHHQQTTRSSLVT